MRVHWLQHAEHEDLGCIAPWLAARGADVSYTPLQAGVAPPASPDFDWLIVMGGPMNIYEHDVHPWLVPEKKLIRAAIDAGRTVLGICLGSQLIADVLGGPVTRNREPEVGWFDVTKEPAGRAHPLFVDWPDRFTAFHWHGDTFAIPPGATHLMRSEGCDHQAYAVGTKVVGLQFHLEVTAANARVWFDFERPAPARYVQPPDAILPQLANFRANNRMMVQLLERMAGS